MTTAAPPDGGVQAPMPELFMVPASFTQRRLWFLDQLAPGRALYNIPDAIRIVGPFDAEALRRSVQEVVRRHESLRTYFRSTKGEPQQLIAAEVKVELPVIEVSFDSQKQREAEVRRQVQKAVDAPFNLQELPLWRIVLLRMAENDHVMAIVMHHIISDGWSLGVLSKEIFQLYATFTSGRPSPLPELPIQYADFSEWQREYLQGEVLEELLGYWKAQLTGTEALNLPLDRPRPSTPAGKGAAYMFRLEKALSERLQSLSWQHKATLYMTLLAAYQTLLFRYTGQEDIAVGSAIAGRTRPEVEDLIGFFVNTLVMRTRLSRQWTFHELLRNVKETTLGAYAHQDIPFDRLVQELLPDRDLQGPMLFQVTFNLQNVPRSKFRLGLAELTPFEFEITSTKFDMSVFLAEEDSSLSFGVIYDQELFESGTIVGMFQRYSVLLQNIVENPDQKLSELPLLIESERRSLLELWRTPELAGSAARTICECVEQWARSNPDSPAIVGNDINVTYQQLNHRANQLAHHLRAIGIKPAARVAVRLEQPDKLLVAVLGVLKAGAIFVPLALEDPILRVREIAVDAGVALVISETRWAEECTASEIPVLNLDLSGAELATQSTEEPDLTVDLHALACVLYRSAPADKPQGVLISHSALSTKWFGREIQLRSSDRLAQILSFSYELATFEIFDALAAGACIVPFPSRPVPSVKDLADLLRRSEATAIFVPAATLADLALQDSEILSQLRLMLCGDRFAALKRLRESLSPEVLERVYWIYGSTETCGSLLVSRITRLDLEMEVTPTERLLQGSKFYLLDDEMAPVPDGVLGELYVSTARMATGYDGHPERTAESFVPDIFSPQEGQRLYRTGDMCRRRVDARLQFCGRRDARIKIHGARVEPAEIETLLVQHPQMREAAVTIRKETGLNEPGLVAFIAFVDDALGSVEELCQYLSERLPEAMLPIEYIKVPAIPRTSEGKPDLDALIKLAEKAEGASEDTPSYVAPRNNIEKQLAEIWAETLEVERVGVHDSFFKLGGHSMLATMVIAQVIDTFQVDLPVRRLFEAPTIAQLAKVIEQLTVEDNTVADETPILVKIQGKGAAAPFFCVHPVGGHVFCYADLAEALGEEQPFYAVQALGPERIDESLATIEGIANLYLQEIRNVQPRGPYFLGGWSIGGVIAWQMTKQVRLEGEAVGMLALIDTNLPLKNRSGENAEEIPPLTAFALDLCQLLGKDYREVAERFLRLNEGQQYEMIFSELQSAGVLPQDPTLAERRLKDFYHVFQRNARASREYQLTPMEQEIVVCEASEREPAGHLSEQWADWAAKVDSLTIPGNHYTILKQPNVSVLAGHLRSALQNAKVESQRSIARTTARN
jgi:amino acid adenylation domain-containing protein